MDIPELEETGTTIGIIDTAKPVEAGISSYRDTHHCHTTRNIDLLLHRFAEDRYRVIGRLVSDPSKLTTDLWNPTVSPLSIDRRCLCQLGESFRRSLTSPIEESELVGDHSDWMFRETFGCAQCRNLSRLVDLRSHHPGKPFMIECGRLVGTQLVIKERDFFCHGSNGCLVLTEGSSLDRTLMERQQGIIGCKSRIPPESIRKRLEVDPFTNEILVSWLLDIQAEEQAIPHVVRSHTAFICGDRGYLVCQSPDLGHTQGLQAVSEILDPRSHDRPTAKQMTFAPISGSVVLGIIKQLLVVLRFGSQFDFIHGSPCGHSIFFDSRPCSYSHDGVHVMCPVTLKLGNFGMSSMTIQSKDGPMRIFPRSESRRTMAKFPFIPLIETIVHVPLRMLGLDGENHSEEPQLTYRLSSSTTPTMIAMRDMGIPLFGGSFDFYAFIVSLMADPGIRSAVQHDGDLGRLWKSLWLPDEADLIENRLSLLTEKLIQNNTQPLTPSFKMVLEVLQGIRLRCDVIETTWERFKEQRC